MSVSQINQDQVNLVCDNLVKAGTRPTAAAVRAVVGSGSQQTILKYLAVWKEKRPEPISTVLPNEIALMLNRHIADSIAATSTELQLQVADAIDERDAAIEETEQVRDSLRAANSIAALDKKESTKQIESLQSEAKEANNLVSKLTMHHGIAKDLAEKLQSQLTALKTKYDVITAERERDAIKLEEMKQELKNSQSQNKQSESQVSGLTGQVRLLEKQLSRLIEDLKRAKF